VRARYNREVAGSSGTLVDAVGQAAAFVYLNKTCFNGLHRVNRRGEFNVPCGRYAKPSIVDAARMRVASRALQDVDIGCAGFEAVLECARAGDFLYLDPPYLPLTRGSFTTYAGEFGLSEHKRLAKVFCELDARGCLVMLSNSAAPDVRVLYRRYRIDTVLARRAINSVASARGCVPECVVRNY
jgi:DNA adenine methylase